MNNEMKTATAVPAWRSRWWLRSRDCSPCVCGGPAKELYVPIWAIPLDILHALIFGGVKLEPIERA